MKVRKGHAVPYSPEQRTIKLICHLRNEGWSLRKIADHLNKHGIQTKAGASNWKAETVRRILIPTRLHDMAIPSHHDSRNLT